MPKRTSFFSRSWPDLIHSAEFGELILGIIGGQPNHYETRQRVAVNGGEPIEVILWLPDGGKPDVEGLLSRSHAVWTRFSSQWRQIIRESAPLWTKDFGQNVEDDRKAEALSHRMVECATVRRLLINTDQRWTRDSAHRMDLAVGDERDRAAWGLEQVLQDFEPWVQLDQALRPISVGMDS
jgi:hypothetical protein